MLSSPVRASLRDGWRCVRRYPVIWRTLAWLGCAYAAFQAAVAWRSGVNFTWVRAGWHDPTAWLHGTPDSIWWLPPGAVRDSLDAGWLPGIEALAGLFNCAVATFPVAVFAALALFTNRARLLSVVWSALVRRFRWGAWLLMPCVLFCAAAVLMKAVLYFRPPWVPDPVWFQWSQTVMWPAALFEYVFGIGVQAYLILHAYAWVRGITFEADALREVAVRRLGAAAKWAGLVLIAQSLFVEMPLALSFACGWPAAPEVMAEKIVIVRFALAGALLVFASMQAWLTLHGETLARAWSAHWRFVRSHSWPLLWFLVIAAVHLFALNFLRSAVLRGLGESTAFGVAWTLVWPWPAGLVTGWLLSAWVCLFKRCER